MRKWLVEYTEGGKTHTTRIEAISSQDALDGAHQMQLNNPVVLGRLIVEVSTNEDGSPDWENAIDWDAIESN